MDDLEWLAGVVGGMTAAPWAVRLGAIEAHGYTVARQPGMGSNPAPAGPCDARGIVVSRNVMAALLEYVRAAERYRLGDDVHTMDEDAERQIAAVDALTAAIRRERERV